MFPGRISLSPSVKLICAMAFGIVVECAAGADSAPVSLQQLKDAIREEVKLARRSLDRNAEQNAFQLQEVLVQLIQIADGEWKDQSVARKISEIEAKADSEKLQTLCHALVKQYQAEEEQREKTVKEEMNKTFAAALRAGLNAKIAAEVDDPMITVSRLVAKRYTEVESNVAIRDLAGQGMRLVDFLREWQDYLAGKGYSSSGFSELQNFRNGSRDFGEWMPRSEVVERLAKAADAQRSPQPESVQKSSSMPTEEQDAKVKKIMAGIRTPPDLQGTIEKLEDLERHVSPASNFLIRNLSTLRSLQHVYFSLESGFAAPSTLLMITMHGPEADDEVVGAVRSQLMSYALPRIVNAGKSDFPKPNESAVAYLQRIAAAARDRSDWPFLGRVLELGQMFNLKPFEIGELTALHSFLAANNLFRARQYTLAVVSFVSALRSGSQVISAEIVGDRLDAIRKEHPKEYEEGIQLVEHPPAAPGAAYWMKNIPPASAFPFAPSAPAIPQPAKPSEPPRQDAASPPNSPATPGATKVK